MNDKQILLRQDTFCICFILDLKRLSDSKFLMSKRTPFKNSRPLKAIVSIPYFIVIYV